jgi:hypothetical protein
MYSFLTIYRQEQGDKFTFDIKAFRLFTQHPTPLSALPKDVRVSLYCIDFRVLDADASPRNERTR